MKKIIYAAMLLLCLGIVAGCSKEPDPKPEPKPDPEEKATLTVAPTSLTFENTGGSQGISITANKAWTISSSQSWCKVSQSSGNTTGSSSVSISVTCDENTAYDERTCTLTVKAGTASQTVEVKQGEGLGLVISQTTYDVSNDAQTIEVEVQANVEYEYTIAEDAKEWITVPGTKALVSSKVKFDIVANDSYDEREGVITFKQKGGALTGTVTVRQSAEGGLIITQTEYDLSNEAQSIEVEVKANVEYEYTIAEDAKEWITASGTKSLVSSKVKFDIAANESYDEREGVITFKQKDGALTGTVTVRQSAEGGLIITQTEYDLSNEAQTIEVEVQANVEYEYTIAEDAKEWITVSVTKVLVSSKVKFDIAANDSYDEREGVITFKQKDGALTGTVTIKQGQSEGLLVEQTEYTVTGETQILEIKVKSNIDYAVTIDNSCSDWISYIETRALSETTVTLKIEENTGRKRTGKIVIGSEDLFDEITIIQKNAENVLEANQIFYTTSDGATIRPNIKFGDATIISNEYVGDKGIITFDKDLTSIGDGAFWGRSSLTSIVIPEGVTSIGWHAFYGCSSLTSIVIPEGVTSIGYKTFEGCSGLTSIVIPEGVTSIEGYAFGNCSSLTSIVIPEGVTSIGESAFYYCSSLTSIVIPEGVTSIWEGAFRDCRNLTSIVIPEGVTSIGDGAFWGCSSLTSIVIPESVTRIGEKTFYDCRNLTSAVIPESVIHNRIGNTFAGCDNLTEIVISEGVTSIGNWAFRDCSGLTSIVIPEGVTSIGEGAFFRCSSLTSIVIPEGVTSIGESAFCYCSSLTSIVIPEGVTSIGESAFKGCSSLTSIVIPEGVTSIGQDAFYDCRNLTSAVIPESVIRNRIGNTFANTFAGCDNLTIVISEGVTSIGAGAFAGCSSLTSIVIPESVTSIGEKAFYDCDGLTSVVIPESVRVIGDYAFLNCSKLAEVIIPEGVTSIGERAFSDCSNLTSVVIPESVTRIGKEAFSGCSGLTSIVISEGVTSIGERAFSDCRNLTSVVIPESVRVIGDYAFLNCSRLAEVIIPEGVTEIGNGAFYNCDGLTSVVIPEGVTSIGEWAFYDCHGLTSVYCHPVTPPSLGANSFPYPSIFVPMESVEAYKQAWSSYARKIQGYEF